VLAYQRLDELTAGAQDVAPLFGLHRRRGGVDGDDDVGAQRSSEVYGQVVDDAAVDEHAPVDLDGRQHHGDRQARPYGPRQASLGEHDRLHGAEIGGHRPERLGETIETALRPEAWLGEQLDQQPVQAVARIPGRRQVWAEPLQVDTKRRGYVVPTTREGDERAHAPAAEHLLPVERPHDLRYLGGRVAGRPQGSDGRAHARTGHAVDDDALFFEHRQDADVGEAASPAAAEHEADTGPARVIGTTRRPGLRARPDHGEHGEGDRRPHAVKCPMLRA
jgi:hypothetical protein